MSADIVPFAFEGVKVRTVLLDNEPWFVVADVAGALGLANPSRVAASLDEDDLRSTEVTDTLGRTQLAYITNEAGVYQTVFQSRKPEAVAFKRWVTRLEGTSTTGLGFQFYAGQGVCERVQVGTRTIPAEPERVIPAQPEREEPIYEVLCADPLREAVAS